MGTELICRKDLDTKINMAACLKTKGNKNDQNLLLRIAKTDAVVKSQQRGEPDLTVDEKVPLLREILERSPSSFLMRFGKYFKEEDLDSFGHLRGDYEIDFRLKEVKGILDNRKRKTGVRNRRYECLQRLMKDSDYFSEDNMRQRSPLLYEQYIGQYLTEEEKYERDKSEIGPDPSLSTLIMARQEKEMNDWMVEYQREQEACMEEEDDSESESGSSGGLGKLTYSLLLKTSYIFNLLSPNSDLSQMSHCDIKGLSVREVMRIENMITQLKFS